MHKPDVVNPRDFSIYECGVRVEKDIYYGLYGRLPKGEEGWSSVDNYLNLSYIYEHDVETLLE
jgi:hypothetical protein